LNILEGFGLKLDQDILKQSGVGKAVMFLFKHPKENRLNKTKAAHLIREWSRPIFQVLNLKFYNIYFNFQFFSARCRAHQG
jgi:hypothetical protein